MAHMLNAPPSINALKQAAQVYGSNSKKLESKQAELESIIRQSSEKFVERIKIINEIDETNKIIEEKKKVLKTLHERMNQANTEQEKLYNAMLVRIKQIRSVNMKLEKDHKLLMYDQMDKTITERTIDYLNIFTKLLKKSLDSRNKEVINLTNPLKNNIGVENSDNLTKTIQKIQHKTKEKDHIIQSRTLTRPILTLPPPVTQMTFPQFTPPSPSTYVTYSPTPPLNTSQPRYIPPTIPVYPQKAECFYWFDPQNQKLDRAPYEFPTIVNSKYYQPIWTFVQPATFLSRVVKHITQEESWNIQVCAQLFDTHVLLQKFKELTEWHYKKWYDKVVNPTKTQLCLDNMSRIHQLTIDILPPQSSCVFVWPKKHIIHKKTLGIQKIISDRATYRPTYSSEAIREYSTMLSSYLMGLWPNRYREIKSSIGKISFKETTPQEMIHFLKNNTLSTFTKDKDVTSYQLLLINPEKYKSSVQLKPVAVKLYNLAIHLRTVIDEIYSIIVRNTPIIISNNFDSMAPLSIPPYELLKPREQEEVKKCRWDINDHKITENIAFTFHKLHTGIVECSTCHQRAASNTFANHLFSLTPVESTVLMGYKHCACSKITGCLKCWILDWIIMRTLAFNQDPQSITNIPPDTLYEDVYLPCRNCGLNFNLTCLSPITWS